MDMFLVEDGVKMVEVSFVKKSEGVLWSAYVGSDGVAAIQLRQLTSGGFELRQGGSEVWKSVSG